LHTIKTNFRAVAETTTRTESNSCHAQRQSESARDYIADRLRRQIEKFEKIIQILLREFN